MTKIDFTLLTAGYCEAIHAHALKGAPHKTIRFYATLGLIKHPEHGYILFDTGYTRRFYEATKRYPLKVYAQITKVFIEEQEEVVNQLKQIGIVANEIKYIILSHFHADHIGGLRDFPEAQIIVQQKAFDDVKGKKGVSALRRGFVPPLMPIDFEERCLFYTLNDSENEDPILGKMYDVFKDGSILLCAMDGHAKGQIGALLKTHQGEVFLVADGAWLKPNYQELKLPPQIIRLFIDSWSDYVESAKRIHQYYKAHPETLIIPCHCEETLKEVMEAQNSMI